MEIIIKFFKKPKSPQRAKAQDIGRKYNYSEDDYYSIIKINEINKDLFDIVNIIFRWSGSSCSIDEYEIETRYLYDLIECYNNKVPPTIIKWYGLERFSNKETDIKEIKEDLEIIEGKINYSNSLLDLGVDYYIRKLIDISLISVIEYNKKYKVEKEEFRNKIIEKTDIIKKIIPEFNNSEVLSIIDSFPEEVEIKEKQIEEDNKWH